MRQLIIDTETTGLDPKQGHRIIEFAASSSSTAGRRAATALPPRSRARDRRRRDRSARDDVGRSEGQAAFRDRRGASSSSSRAAPSGSSTTRRSTSRSSTTSSRAQVCRPARPSYGSLVDTLALARETFPGKRNNLDALCERFGVSNAHRTLHGALLDAQLLAEVYLAMTRGQESLTIDMGAAPAAAAGACRSARPAQRAGAARAAAVAGRARGARAPTWKRSTATRRAAACGCASRASRLSSLRRRRLSWRVTSTCDAAWNRPPSSTARRCRPLPAVVPSPCTPPLSPQPVRRADQPRAVAARVQPARAGAGRGRERAAARAAALPVHRRQQPRRVLRDPRRRREGAVAREDAAAGHDAADARDAARAHGRRGARADRRPVPRARTNRCCRRSRAPACGSSAAPSSPTPSARGSRSYFEREVRPLLTPIGLDPAHPFPQVVNKSLNFVIELSRQRRVRPRDRHRDRQGAARAAARSSSCRATWRARPRVRDAVVGDPRAPGRALPRARGRRLLAVPRHARRRPVDRRGGSQEPAQALQGELPQRQFGSAVRLEVADDARRRSRSSCCSSSG